MIEHVSRRWEVAPASRTERMGNIELTSVPGAATVFAVTVRYTTGEVKLRRRLHMGATLDEGEVRAIVEWLKREDRLAH